MFALVAVLLAILLPSAALLAVDIYLHGRFQKSAGYNIWGYRGPIVGRKQPGEIRVVVVGGSTAYGYGVNWDQAMPACLERALAAKTNRRFTVVNLGYNNEGAYSLKLTLQDYAYLDYDLAILYENYNDLLAPPEIPNLAAYRRDSPVFRLTGYLPIFPIVFKEKAAMMLHGGDAGALYRLGEKTVFRPTIPQRAAAGVLNTAAEFGQSLERQLDRMTAEPQRRVVDADASGCSHQWAPYCRSMLDAIDVAVRAGKRVIAVGQPYEAGATLRPWHMTQQRELAAAVARRFGGNPGVRYVNLGTTVELADPTLSFDAMHLTPKGNAIIADALVAPVLAMTSDKQVSIQPLHIVDEALDAVARDDALASGAAHQTAPIGIVEQRADRCRERRGVAERRQQADAVADHVADAADVGADAGHGGGKAFDQRDGRALVARRQQEDVGRAVDRRQIAAPAEKARAIVDAEIARRAFELAAQLAVAGDQKERARVGGRNPRRGIEKQPMLLDGRQAADRRDDLRVDGYAKSRSRCAAIRVGNGRQRRQIEAERDHSVLFRTSDSILLDQLALNLRRDCDDRVRRACELAFGADEQSRDGRTEIPLEHVTVVGVHDARARAAAGCAVVGERGQAADRAGLRHVRVDDRGTEAAQRAIHLRERDHIVSRCDGTPERCQLPHVDAAVREQIAHVAFALAEPSVDQQRVDAARRESFGERRRLDGRPADVEAGDDSGDAHRRDNTNRVFGGGRA